MHRRGSYAPRALRALNVHDYRGYRLRVQGLASLVITYLITTTVRFFHGVLSQPKNTTTILAHYAFSALVWLIGWSVLWPPREQCPTVISLTHSHSCERDERSVRIRENEERERRDHDGTSPNLRRERATSFMHDPMHVSVVRVVHYRHFHRNFTDSCAFLYP